MDLAVLEENLDVTNVHPLSEQVISNLVLSLMTLSVQRLEHPAAKRNSNLSREF